MSEEEFSSGEWMLNTEFGDNIWFLDVVNNKNEPHQSVSEFCVKMADDSSDGDQYDEELKANAYLQSEAKNMYNLLKELKGVSMGAYPEIIEKQLARSRGEK